MSQRISLLIVHVVFSSPDLQETDLSAVHSLMATARVFPTLLADAGLFHEYFAYSARTFQAFDQLPPP